MSVRIQTICSYIPKSKVFADVGCDHGFCTEYVLQNNLTGKAYISDVSRESLQKAVDLLEKDVNSGRCIPVCTDGLKGFPETPDCVLIAGMGGMEIIHILERQELPEKFVLQPMKNAEKVRSFLLERGVTIEKDLTFYDGKYYDLIVGKSSGNDRYSPWELEFGRDNLRSPTSVFERKIESECKIIRKRLERDLSPKSRDALLEKLYRTEVVLDAIKGDI